MRTLLIALSSLLTLASIIPYYLDIAKGKDKPRIATWFIWTILAIIAGSASLIDHQIPAGIFTLATGLECGMVVILGLQHGDRTFEKLDYFCLTAAFLSLGLWFVFRSPTVGVVVVLFADFIGSIPTFKHCWQKPYEETLLTYVLYVASEIMILSIANFGVFTSFAYPLFYFLEDSTLSLFIIFSPHRKNATEKTAVQDNGSVTRSPSKLTSKLVGYEHNSTRNNWLPAPTGLKIRRKENDIFLSWDFYPEAISYSIYKNGIFVGSSPVNSYTDYYSSNSISSYYVTALNSHKLESGGSNKVSSLKI